MQLRGSTKLPVHTVSYTAVFTFRVSGRRHEMYIGQARLSVCVSVCLSLRRRIPTLLHVSGCKLGEW